MVEGDIKSFFDSIDHHVLARLLQKNFAEKRLFTLYWKFVQAGYIEFKNKKKIVIAADIGVPQGGILSPLLSNLILHELDCFIAEKKRQFEESSAGEKSQKTNPKYSALTHLIKKCRAINARKELVDALKLRRNFKPLHPNPKYARIEYVRYADD